MRFGQFGAAAAFMAVGGVIAIVGAPLAVADSCDPAVTICQGGDVQGNGGSSDFSPSVSAPGEQYPYDNEWYFNPAGGSTALQPDRSSGGGSVSGGGVSGGGVSGGGVSGGGGGGRR